MQWSLILLHPCGFTLLLRISGSVSGTFVQSSGGEECDAGVSRRLHLTIVFKLCVTVFGLRFPVSF
jgi:hypothetical protein